MKEGEEISVGNGEDENEYRCMIDRFEDDKVFCKLMFVKEANVELPAKVILYQCLPNSDKMELIITKAVELGVFRVVPVATARAVVKLDGDRAGRKITRWNSISEAAAKQSKRAIIPEVTDILSFSEALGDCRSFEAKIIPYELSDPDSMKKTRDIIDKIRPGTKVAVFIGPEGGFTQEEIELAVNDGFEAVTLGHRILRTETAGLVMLAWINYAVETK